MEIFDLLALKLINDLKEFNNQLKELIVYSPKIREDLIPYLYQRAKNENKPMTRVVNDILSAEMIKPYYCQSCNNSIEVDEGSKDGYCEKCDCLVFIKTAQQ